MEKFNEHIIIRGLLFDIGCEPMKLTEHGNPENQFFFDPKCIYKGCIVMDVDLWNGNAIYQLTGENPVSDYVRIPVALFEKGYISSYAMAESINENSRKNNWHFLVPDELMFKRVKGELPDFRIGMDMFHYDGERELIIPADGKTPPLQISDFEEFDDDDTDYYEAFYHLPSRQVYQKMDIDTLTEWPKDVVYLSIPGPESADPIGWARKHKLPDFTYLSRQMKYTHYRANIRDISADYYEYIMNNRKKIAHEIKKVKPVRKRR